MTRRNLFSSLVATVAALFVTKKAVAEPRVKCGTFRPPEMWNVLVDSEYGKGSIVAILHSREQALVYAGYFMRRKIEWIFRDEHPKQFRAFFEYWIPDVPENPMVWRGQGELENLTLRIVKA